MSTVTAAPAANFDKEFEAAERAFRTASTRRAKAEPPDFLSFASQMQFLLTIGYLTKPQAEALLAWFQSSGTAKLPALAGPDGVASPTMYEVLSTAVHFRTPPGDLTDDEGIVEFFSGLVDAVGDLIGIVTDGATDLLMGAGVVIEAGAHAIHELHDLVILAP